RSEQTTSGRLWRAWTLRRATWWLRETPSCVARQPIPRVVRPRYSPPERIPVQRQATARRVRPRQLRPPRPTRVPPHAPRARRRPLGGIAFVARVRAATAFVETVPGVTVHDATAFAPTPFHRAQTALTSRRRAADELDQRRSHRDHLRDPHRAALHVASAARVEDVDRFSDHRADVRRGAHATRARRPLRIRPWPRVGFSLAG